MAEYHRRKNDPEDTFVHERKSDSDKWAKMGEIVEHYKIAWAFWIIVASAAGWFSHQVVEPLKAIPTIQAQQAEINKKLQNAQDERKDMQDVLKIVVKMLCAQTPQSDRFKYGINCSAIPVPDLGSTSLIKPTQ